MENAQATVKKAKKAHKGKANSMDSRIVPSSQIVSTPPDEQPDLSNDMVPTPTVGAQAPGEVFEAGSHKSFFLKFKSFCVSWKNGLRAIVLRSPVRLSRR